MELRFFTTYDENGVDSEQVLQYWSEDDQKWYDVDSVRVREQDEEESLREPPY